MIAPALEQSILQRIQQVPAFSTLGVKDLRFEQGYCEAVVPRNTAYDGIFECYHGGMLMTAADTVACLAVMTHTGPDATLTTTDMNIRFVAPCLTDVRAVARLIKPGKTLHPTQVYLYDLNGKLVAVAQVCYMQLAHKPQRLTP